MKKVLIMLCVGMFTLAVYADATSACTINLSNSFTSTDSQTDAFEGILLAEGDKFIESVEAQNQDGNRSRYFKIMARQLANGRYFFYAQDRNGTYDIQYIDTNRYKPFYLYADGERWYFASKDLDYYAGTGKTTQW